MRKLFLFILIVLGLSSCAGWSVSTTPYYNYSYYNDYRNHHYNPHNYWTDVVYSNYYYNYRSNIAVKQVIQSPKSNRSPSQRQIKVNSSYPKRRN